MINLKTLKIKNQTNKQKKNKWNSIYFFCFGKAIKIISVA